MDWKQKLKTFLEEREQRHAWVNYAKDRPEITDATMAAWADALERMSTPTEEEIRYFIADLNGEQTQ